MAYTTKITEHEGYSIIELINENNTCTATIHTIGALLQSYNILQPNNEWHNAVFANADEDVKADLTKGFKSAKLAPFVCRMNHGKYTYQNKHYHIEKFYMGEHAIHGLVFDQTYEIKNVTGNETGASVELETYYFGLDAGYPFQFKLNITWALGAQNKLSATTKMQHYNDGDILFADGWHPYFTLGENVDDWHLQFGSKELVEFNDTLIPTGKILQEGRFINGTKLKGIELDNCFKLATPFCQLTSDKLQLTITPDASYPYQQVYIPKERNRIAIENLSSAPDAFNNGMGLLIAKPATVYTFKTTYHIANI